FIQAQKHISCQAKRRTGQFRRNFDRRKQRLSQNSTNLLRSQFFTAKLVDLTTFSVVNYTGALSAPDRKKKWEDIGTMALRQNDLGNDDIKQLVRRLAIPSM